MCFAAFSIVTVQKSEIDYFSKAYIYIYIYIYIYEYIHTLIGSRVRVFYNTKQFYIIIYLRGILCKIYTAVSEVEGEFASLLTSK